MSGEFSLVIRNGTVFDGTGGEPIEADVGVRGSSIAAIAPKLGRAEVEIDARGYLVTPGFVDVHTHYDAQATWSSQITPSSWNGVTTAMIGNCGVGFAPCRPEQRTMLIELMEGVEDIPEVVLSEGIPWTWQSFEQFLDALASRRYDLDVVAQVPHAALRVFVMGQRGADRETATEAECAEMARLAAAGIRAGALGFSTSRTLNHRTVDGRLIPTLQADEAELAAIAGAIGKIGAGWLQVISDFDDLETEFAILRRVVERSGRPMAITVLQRDAKPDGWRELMALIADARRAELPMIGQVITRPTGVLLGLELSLNPFSARPSMAEIAHLSLDAKLARLRDPEFKTKLLGEAGQDDRLVRRCENWARIFPFDDPPDYEPGPEQSLDARARREGRRPEEVAYDLLVQGDGRTILYRPLSNYTHGTLDTVREMITRPDTLISLGDGGAHVGALCDASALTYLLTHWTRDRERGERLPLAWAIKRLSADNAAAIGLHDRGVLRTGAKADINIVDYDNLKLRRPQVVRDLPAGGRRLIQRTEGYVATINAGKIVYRHGEATGELPGRLVRGDRAG